MNLQKFNPINWLPSFGGKDAGIGANTTVRQGNALGPYTSSAFKDFVFRECNPHLYEAIRESMGPIDGAINKMVMLDGMVRVDTDNQVLDDHITEWMEGVRVNDMEQGFQSFYRSQGNELYEQGFTIGGYEFNNKLSDVGSMRVADSKGIYFRRVGNDLEVWYAPPGQKRGRNDGTDNVERVLRNTYQHHNDVVSYLQGSGYRKLDRQHLVYAGYNNEADNPYGVSIMRSTEFDAKVLLVMKNALYRTWERFGDPIFNVTLKKKRAPKDQGTIDAQRTALAKNMADAMAVKKSGNSADVVNVIGPDDELTIAVMGADGQVLEIEMPARHLLENVVAKTGLPSWMLGFHWSTAERLAGRQSEIVLQESVTRFDLRKPQLKKPIMDMLRARGVAFDARDFTLVQDLPNLQDVESKARARLMNTQADVLAAGGDLNPEQNTNTGTEDDDAKKAVTVYRLTNNKEDAQLLENGERLRGKGCKGHNHKSGGESYVEDEAALLSLEDKAEGDLLNRWDQLYDDTVAVLDKGMKSLKADTPVFMFDPAIMYADLIELMDQFIAGAGGEDSETVKAMIAAWERGVLNAASEPAVGLDQVLETTRSGVASQMTQRGFELVRNDAIRAYKDDILQVLSEGAYNGLNPKEVASKLKARFDAHDYDWQRLARSEIADAQVSGKLDQYAAHELEQYDWIRAGGACPICVGLAEGGPYSVDEGAPRPMRDSHPQCRCTVTARVD